MAVADRLACHAGILVGPHSNLLHLGTNRNTGTNQDHGQRSEQTARRGAVETGSYDGVVHDEFPLDPTLFRWARPLQSQSQLFRNR